MIFQRALVRELVSAASATFIALFTIFITISLVRLLGQAAAGHVDNRSLVALISFTALNNVPVLLPPTIFIAVLLVFTRSYGESEMIVWLSSGLGLSAWLRPLLRFAIPVALVVSGLSLIVMPWANRQSSEFKARFEQRNDVARVAPGQFRESAAGDRVFFVEGLSQGAAIVRNVFVSTFQGKQLGLVVAQSGRMERETNGENFLVLQNGRRYDGTPGQPDFKLIEFNRYAVRIDPQPTDFSGDDESRDKSTMQLLAQHGPREMAELSGRLALPLSVLILSVLAIPLSFVNPRAGRSANLMIAVLVYFTYLNVQNLVQIRMAQGKIEFSLGFWIVHAIVLVLALIMLSWRNRVHRSWRARLHDWFGARAVA